MVEKERRERDNNENKDAQRRLEDQLNSYQKRLCEQEEAYQGLQVHFENIMEE